MRTQWKEYLTRPFDLLGTSLWVRWYSSPQIQKAVSATLTKARCVELPTRSVVQYRDGRELARFERAIRRLTEKDPKRIRRILQKASTVNRRASTVLRRKKTTLDLRQEIRFLTDLGVYVTVLPFFIGRYLPEHRTHERSMLISLRTHSYYLQYHQKVILPLASSFLRYRKYPAAVAHDCTVKELFSGSIDAAVRRHALRHKGRTFIYEYMNGKETVRMERHRASSVHARKSVDMTNLVAYPGIVRGRVRIVHDRDDARGITAKHVLVAPSTNPNLAPFMKRAAAIVTNEGGMISHAAIIARELHKPCIVGTKHATQVLKDGDMVEVDANLGIVKKV